MDETVPQQLATAGLICTCLAGLGVVALIRESLSSRKYRPAHMQRPAWRRALEL